MTDAASRRPSFSWGLAIGTLLFIAAAYRPAVQGEFLMSDVRVVVDNARLTSLEGLRSVWSPTRSDVYALMDQYQPLHYSLLWLEHQLWGLEARAYQGVSIVLHALNALLVCALLARIGLRGAPLAAMLFALHPVHVESVAWIYEQKNVLSGAFFFLALLAYLKFEDRRRRSWYAVALVSFAAALLSKASTVVLPALILLLQWFRREPWSWRSLAPTLPFFGMSALMAVVTIWYEGAVSGATGEFYSAGLLERAVRAGWVVWFHAGQLLVPVKLAFFYPRWSVNPSDWLVYLPDLLLLVAIAVVWLWRDSWGRPALLGVGWYLVLMFPIMGFFDIYYHQFSLAADHFQYLASVGLIALAVHAGVAGLERVGVAAIDPETARPNGAALTAVVLVVAVSWFLAWQRSHVFANDGLLARDAANKYPKSWLAFQKCGEFLMKRASSSPGDTTQMRQQAIADLEHAVAIRPDEPQTHDSLGTAYFMSGRLDDAHRHMQIAVDSSPTNPMFRTRLAKVLERKNEIERALAEYREIVAVVPTSVGARMMLARALIRAERFHEGIGALAAAIELAAPQASGRPGMAAVLHEARRLKAQTAARVAATSVAPVDEGRPGAAWNVLLLTVDTLRPDYLSLNGYQRPTSPALDALLGSGFYFEQAVTPVPRTTPAVASLLTGAYPHTTGVRSLADPLSGDLVTLAEAFQNDGYQTLAVVTNLLLATIRGLNAGFDVYDAAIDIRTARQTTEAALRHIEAADPDVPLFAWVHYIDPHVPYHPRAEIAEQFDPAYGGRFRLSFGRQPRGGEPDDLFREFPEGLTRSQVIHDNPLTAEENEHIRQLYAGDIRMLDQEIDGLIGAVCSRFPRTVIVFASDHGESLGEHDFYFDHGDYVYDASARVPLAFVLPPEHPWHGAGRLRGWVSLVDVAPTLFDLVEREPPPEMAALFEGRSLAPSLRGENQPPAPVFVESGTSFFPELVHRRQRNDVAGRFRAVTLEDWKLIWTPFLPEAEAWELYDLGADPDETRNLYRPDHPRVPRLKRHLDRWIAAAPPNSAPARSLTEEDRAALRRLGYVE